MKDVLVRILNVAATLCYIGVLLIITVFIFQEFTSNRDIVSANVQCKNGEKYSAFKNKGEMWGMYQLCGICTKRNAITTEFRDCTYNDIDYDSYEIVDKKRGEINWGNVGWGVLGYVIALFIIDLINIGLAYIITGKINPKRSVLLNIIILYNSK